MSAEADGGPAHDDAGDAGGAVGDSGAADDDGEVANEPPSLSSGDQDSAGESEAESGSLDGEGADGPADPDSPTLPLLPLDGELVLLPELGLVEQGDLTEALVLAVNEHDASRTRPPSLSGVLAEGEATSCWRDLATTNSFDRYAAARAQLGVEDGQRQGDPVVVLLGLDADGSARSWVMPEGCTTDADVSALLEGEPRP